MKFRIRGNSRNKYVVLKTMNRNDGKEDYVSYDVIKDLKDGSEFVAEFEHKTDAKLFARIKNKRRK